MIAAESDVHLVIGSQIENIDLVQVVLEESLQKLRVEPDTSHSISISVREAVANAIEHGNERDPEKRVRVDLEVENQEVVIRVTDEGRGFDPDRVADPRAPANLLRPSGRGILFMNNYMDSIDYSFQAGGGTVVTLRKRLVTAPAERVEQGGQMKIPSRKVEEVTVLEPKGKITIGVGDVALRESVHDALEAGERNILVDLSGVTTMDSSGVGELVSAFTTVTNRGGKLKLLKLPAKVQDIMQITQLITVFETFDDEPEALNSF